MNLKSISSIQRMKSIMFGIFIKMNQALFGSALYIEDWYDMILFLNTFHFYLNDPNDSTSISHNSVRFILPGDNDILWIGTRGGGLNKFDKKTGRFTSYKHDSKNPQSISQDVVICIYDDQKGNLWLGTNSGGLNRFDLTDESFTSFDFGGAKESFKLFDYGGGINSIYEDRKGILWIGTYHTGIHLFDKDKGISIDNLTEKDGLANDMVGPILEDDSGNLWIGTINGLSRFDLQTRSFKNYFNSDGFEANYYWSIGACKTSTGEMLFCVCRWIHNVSPG